jgi:hypothetical protein
MATIGDRCFAIASRKGNVVRVFGYGTYAGHQEVPVGRGPFGIDMPGFTNVCIDLDTGERVFGHECWWGVAEVVEPKIAGCEIQNITIDDYYQEANAG